MDFIALQKRATQCRVNVEENFGWKLGCSGIGGRGREIAVDVDAASKIDATGTIGAGAYFDVNASGRGKPASKIVAIGFAALCVVGKAAIAANEFHIEAFRFIALVATILCM